MEKLGFDHVVDYEGGIEEWKKKGHPIETAMG
ncbi:MAG: rhodanese-like domain-containing protein [Candidatus Natronoplasma sp.]